MGLWDTLKSAATDAITNATARTIADTAQASVQAKAAAQMPQPQAAPAPAPMTGPEFEPVCGVSLQHYAELCAAMSDCGEDEAQCLAIADADGVTPEAWDAAKTVWTARMADPALLNRVSNAFLSFYSPAMDRKRGGQPPMTLEQYVRIFAETSFRKDPLDPSKQIDREVVLAEQGVPMNRWNEALVYWSPKVSDANDPVFPKYQQLIKAEMERLTGR